MSGLWPSLRSLWRLKAPRPTRNGWGFFAFVVVTLVGCVNYQLSMGYLLAFLLLGVLACCMLEAAQQGLGVSGSVLLPERLFAGGPWHAKVVLDSRSSGVITGVCVGSGANFTVHHLAASGRLEVTVELAEMKRGVHRFVPPVVRVQDVLGLFEALVPLKAPERLVVFPKPELGAPPFPLGAEGLFEGRHASFGVDDFWGLRPYRKGDRLSSIAWRRVSATGELVTKEFRGAQGGVALLDASALSALPLEARLSRLTAWLLQLEHLQQPNRLVLEGKVEEGQGTEHTVRALTLLASVGGNG